jgi:hypothetical protein
MLTVIPEYILWWLREGRVPALLTTSSTASQGILGQPDTRILYGDGRLPTRHDDRFNGVRLTVEWMNANETFGLEARGFLLERDSTHFKATSDGTVLLALPFTGATNGQPGSQLVAGQDPQRGLLTGGFVGYSRIEWFGEELNGVMPLSPWGCWRLDLLAGARFLQMRDRFNYTAVSYTVAAPVTLYSEMDNLRTGNAYYGAQVGLRGERDFGRFYLQLRGTIGLGADTELIRIFGASIYQTPQGRQLFGVGLFAQPSNTGSFSRVAFDGAGEVAVNAGYRLTSWARLFVGYTFLYWADPLRAGDQIDTVVYRRQGLAPGPARPIVPFKGDALWAQGVNAGVEFHW